MRAGQQAGVQHIAQVDVIHEGWFSCDQLDGVDFALRFTDNAQVGGGAGADEGGGTALSRRVLTGCGGAGRLVRGSRVGIVRAVFGMFQRRAAGVPRFKVFC